MNGQERGWTIGWHLSGRLLSRLVSYGLLVRSGDRWSVVVDLDAALALVAEELGLTGRTQAVRAQHERETAGYLAWREQNRPARQMCSRRRTAAVRAGLTGLAVLPFDDDLYVSGLCWDVAPHSMSLVAFQGC